MALGSNIGNREHRFRDIFLGEPCKCQRHPRHRHTRAPEEYAGLTSTSNRPAIRTTKQNRTHPFSPRRPACPVPRSGWRGPAIICPRSSACAIVHPRMQPSLLTAFIAAGPHPKPACIIPHTTSPFQGAAKTVHKTVSPPFTPVLGQAAPKFLMLTKDHNCC